MAQMENLELRAAVEAEVKRAAGEREFFSYNLLVRILLIIEIIRMNRPCAMGV